jgi:hypothetical protein
MSYRVWKAELLHRGFQFERKRTIRSGDNPVAVLIGLRRLENSSVSDVSVVSDVYPIGGKSYMYRKSDTTGTTGTVSIQTALCLKPLSNSEFIETMFGADVVKEWLNKGILVELPAGTYKLE